MRIRNRSTGRTSGGVGDVIRSKHGCVAAVSVAMFVAAVVGVCVFYDIIYVVLWWNGWTMDTLEAPAPIFPSLWSLLCCCCGGVVL